MSNQKDYKIGRLIRNGLNKEWHSQSRYLLVQNINRTVLALAVNRSDAFPAELEKGEIFFDLVPFAHVLWTNNEAYKRVFQCWMTGFLFRKKNFPRSKLNVHTLHMSRYVVGCISISYWGQLSKCRLHCLISKSITQVCARKFYSSFLFNNRDKRDASSTYLFYIEIGYGFHYGARA